MRNWLKVGLVGAVAALTVGATSSVAYADTETSKCYASSDDAGGVDCYIEFWHNSTFASYGEFMPLGEHLFARDALADGRGVYMSARWDDSSGHNHFQGYWLTSGAGTTRYENLSIAEGTHVTFTACQTDNGALLNCRSRTATA